MVIRSLEFCTSLAKAVLAPLAHDAHGDNVGNCLQESRFVLCEVALAARLPAEHAEGVALVRVRRGH